MGRMRTHVEQAIESETEAPSFELSLPARPENVAVVRHAMGGLAEAVDVPDQVLADVKLAVTEACTNCVVHAYGDEEGPMDVIATIAGRRLQVVISDHGRGIVPRADSPGLGLGLPLIATLATSLELGGSESGGSQVRMTFDLDGTPGSPDAAA